MGRALFFVIVGVNSFIYWLMANPSYEESPLLYVWGYLLWFSAMLLSLTFALPTLARLGGQRMFLVSLIPATGTALSAVANILEDGLRLDWAFWPFVVGSGITLLGLLILTGVMVFAGRERQRILAVVPAGTLAAIAMFVEAGGPVMLATWLVAAALTLSTRAARQSVVPVH